MSWAPHCCPGPHLLITICHLSCALHIRPLPLSSSVLISPLKAETTLSLLDLSHFPIFWLYVSFLHRLLSFLRTILFSDLINFPGFLTPPPPHFKPVLSFLVISVHISIFSSSFSPPTSVSFHSMAKHTKWFHTPEVHILILTALQG